MKFLRLLLWSSLLLTAPAVAQQSVLSFARADIQIYPAPAAPARDGEVVMVRPTLHYNIEVRSQEALRLEYIHTLNTLTDSTGVMIVLGSPSTINLPYMQVLTPVDVLFVAADGVIVKMIPNVVLGTVDKSIAAQEPIKALLFLKTGQIAARLIKPGDTVVGNMFSASPMVQQ